MSGACAEIQVKVSLNILSAFQMQVQFHTNIPPAVSLSLSLIFDESLFVMIEFCGLKNLNFTMWCPEASAITAI